MQSEETGKILNGKVIITTYPEKADDELKAKLSKLGATVLSMPVIEISPLTFQLDDPEQYDWFVFTSKNAVKPFARRYSIPHKKIAALGAQTAEMLKEYNFTPTFTGTGKSSTDFANEFLPQVKADEKILLILGNLAPNHLQHAFSEKVATDRVNVYRTQVKKVVDETTLNRIAANEYDLIVVTSPSAVNAIFQLLPSKPKELRLISIGKTTDVAIRNFEMQPVATAKIPAYEKLADTIIDYYKNDQ